MFTEVPTRATPLVRHQIRLPLAKLHLTTVQLRRQLGCGRSAHGSGAGGVHRFILRGHSSRLVWIPIQTPHTLANKTHRIVGDPKGRDEAPRGLKLHQTIVYSHNVYGTSSTIDKGFLMLLINSTLRLRRR